MSEPESQVDAATTEPQTAPQTDSPPIKQRWYQLSWTAMVGLVLFAAVAVYYSIPVWHAWREHMAVAAIREAGGEVSLLKGTNFIFKDAFSVAGRVPINPPASPKENEKFNYTSGITDAEMEYVGRFSELTRIDLEGCAITDAGLQPLKELTKLELVRLKNTKVTPEGIAELQRALPRCQITK
jgi:hypothetical protein